MLNPKDLEASNLVNVEFELDTRQRGVLYVYSKQEGFDLLQRLMLNVIHDFNAVASNAITDADIVRTHRNAKVAAQFYTGFMERVAYEINVEEQITNVGSTPDNPLPAAVTEDFQ